MLRGDEDEGRTHGVKICVFNLELFFGPGCRSDLPGGCHHVLAGLGDGSGGGHLLVHTGGLLGGLLSSPGGGIPAGRGEHPVLARSQLGQSGSIELSN